MAATHAASAHPAARPLSADPASPSGHTVGSVALLLRFGAVMALVLAAASAPASSLFAVREITVLGAEHIPVSAIMARSGLRAGDRLFADAPSRIAGRIARIPRIHRSWVSLGLGGAVTIHVEERHAYAAVPYRGRYLILDPSAVVMDAASSAGALPLVTSDGFAPPWVRLGDRLPDRGVAVALDALDDLPQTVLVPGTKIRAEPSGDLVLVTPDRIAVRLGPLRGLRDRAAALAPLLDALRARGLAVEYLDLRFSGNVVMKPAAVGAGERP